MTAPTRTRAESEEACFNYRPGRANIHSLSRFIVDIVDTTQTSIISINFITVVIL